MERPLRPGAGLAPRVPSGLSANLSSARTARAGLASRRVQPLTRRYEVSCLLPNGDIDQFSRVAPATPVFEDAFAALGRGALISTAAGPVAVEDLMPGDLVDTVDHGPQTLQWLGAMTVFPATADVPGGEAARLTRLATDAFGLGRPHPDLVLGPRARVLFRHAKCRALIGAPAAFAPAHAFADGVSVVEVNPVSPVRVYHLAFDRQQTILANGIEIESYHPGTQAEAMMSSDMLEMFLTLFPHVTGLDGFGPMDTPRLTGFELESLRAA